MAERIAVLVTSRSKAVADAVMVLLPDPVLSCTSRQANRRYLFYCADGLPSTQGALARFLPRIEFLYFPTLPIAFDWAVEDARQHRLLATFEGAMQ